MSDLPRISRQFSQRSVMEAIVQGGPISRASISKQTGLSKQTISEIVRQLEQEGWVQETGRTSGHVGRTAVTYELVPDAAYIVAVDLGGTKVRVALDRSRLPDLRAKTRRRPTRAAASSSSIRSPRLPSRLRPGSAFRARTSASRSIGVPGAPDHVDRPHPACAEHRRTSTRWTCLRRSRRRSAST